MRYDEYHMDEQLEFENRTFITTNLAAELTGYSSDYVGQLARQGNFESKKIAGRRFVDRDELITYADENKSSFSLSSLPDAHQPDNSSEDNGSQVETESNAEADESESPELSQQAEDAASVSPVVIQDDQPEEENEDEISATEDVDEMLSTAGKRQTSRWRLTRDKHRSDGGEVMKNPVSRLPAIAMSLMLVTTIGIASFGLMDSSGLSNVRSAQTASENQSVEQIAASVESGLLREVDEASSQNRQSILSRSANTVADSVELAAAAAGTTFNDFIYRPVRNLLSDSIYTGLAGMIRLGEIFLPDYFIDYSNDSFVTSGSGTNQDDVTDQVQAITRLENRSLSDQVIVTALSRLTGVTARLAARIEDPEAAGDNVATRSYVRDRVDQLQDMMYGNLDSLMDAVEYTHPNDIELATADIGTTTSAILEVTGQTTLSQTQINGPLSVIAPNSTSSNTLFVDTANSRVGINTDTPQYALDVNGTFRADTFISNSTSSANNFTASSTYTNTLVADESTTTIAYIENLLADSSTTTNAYIASLVADAIDATNATTTNAYITNLLADQSTTTDAYITNLIADTTNLSDAEITNLVATQSTTTNAYVVNLLADALDVTQSTTTNAFIQSLVTTDATTTNSYIASLVADNSTTTNAFITSLVADTSELTDAEITNLIATNSTTTNAYIASLLVDAAEIVNSTTTNAYIENLLADSGDVTEFTAENATITSATTTNFFASLANFTTAFFDNLTATVADITNLEVDNATTTNLVATDATTTNLTVTGDTVLGSTALDTLTVNATVETDLVPNSNANLNIGSPSFYWGTAYLDTINANNISAASTSISGTAANDFTLNTDNTTQDGEDISLIFYRGQVTPNAVIRWDSAADRLDFNQSLFVNNESGSTTNPSLIVEGVPGQTADLFRLASSSGDSLFSVGADGSVDLISASATDFTATNATTTNFFASLANFTTAFFDNLTATVADITNLEVDNATTTNLVATDADINTATIDSLTLDGLTNERLLSLNASGGVTNTDLIDWLEGTTDQVDIIDNADGTVTLTLPQDIAATAAPTFDGMTLSGLLSFTGTDHAGIRLNELTDAERNALTPQEGMVIFNETEGKVQAYTGAEWKNVGSMAIGEEVESATTGSVLFVDASGNLAEDNDNFFWDASNQRLGIGTSTPSDALTVSGDITATGQIGVSSQFTLRDGGLFVGSDRSIYSSGGQMILDGNGLLQLSGAGASSDVVVDSAGRVGIGTTTPAVSLDINDTDAVRLPVGTTAQRPSGELGYIRYNSENSQFEGFYAGAWQGLGGVIDVDQDTYITAEESSDEDYLRFYTGGSEQVTITDAGDVGIGVANPSAMLQINDSTTNTTDSLLDLGRDGNSLFRVRPSQNTGNRVMVEGDGDLVQFSFEQTVFRAPTGDTIFQIGGSGSEGRFEGFNVPLNFVLRAQSGGYFNFEDESTGNDLMRITQGGNVGIGITNPANTLDVDGGIDADTLNTGQGDNELYAMDQDVQTTDEVTFAGINGTNATITNATTTNFFASVANFGSAIFNSFTATLADITNLEADNATTTNLVAGNLTATSSITTPLTSGSVPYIGAGGSLSEDNANFFWDDANGRLGIGTTTPQSALEVAGDVNITGGNFTVSSDNFPLATFERTSGNNASFEFRNNVATRFFGVDPNGNFAIGPNDNLSDNPFISVDAAGKVGFSTTSPAVALDINATDAVRLPVGTTAQRPSGELGYIRYNSENSQFEGFYAGAWQGLGGVIDVDQDTYITAEESSDEDYLRFYTGGSERMTVADTGNVGIGTTNPAELLEVAGSGGTRFQVSDDSGFTAFRLSGAAGETVAADFARGSTNYWGLGMKQQSGNDDFWIWDARQSDDPQFIIESTTGRTGIREANPQNTLDVNGGIDADTLNTGQGDNELYAMDQDVQTTDEVTFAGINGTNATITNATTSNFFASVANFTTAIFDTITATVASFTNLEADNATTTNLVATDATTTNLTASGQTDLATTSVTGDLDITSGDLRVGDNNEIYTTGASSRRPYRLYTTSNDKGALELERDGVSVVRFAADLDSYINRSLSIGTTTLPSTALDVDGTATVNALAVGGDTINDFTGTGLSVSANVLNVSLSPFSTDDLAEGSNLYFTDQRARDVFSTSATGLTYTSGTGVLSLTSGYSIPLTASTTDWQNFYQTPSTRITAGTGLSWSGNTLDTDDIETLTTSLTAGSIIFSDGNNLAQDNANFFWDDANNRLGIGTTTPSAILEIVGDGSTPYLRIGSGGGGTYAFEVDENDKVSVGTGNDHIYLNTSGGTNVGVGTSSPISDFTVVGDSYFEGDVDVTGTTTLNTLTLEDTFTLGDDSITDITGEGLSVVSQPGGGLGLNVDDIETLSTGLGAGSIIFSDGSFLTQDSDNFFWDDANDRLGIGTNTPTTALDVVGTTTVDRLGIGTTNPREMLDVVGTGRAEYMQLILPTINTTGNVLRIGDNPDDYGFDFRYTGADTGNDNGLELWTDGEASGQNTNRVFRVLQSGNIRFDQNVGIGTDAPDESLHIRSTSSRAFIELDGGGVSAKQDTGIRFESGNIAWEQYFERSPTTNMYWEYDGTEAMRLAGDGDLTIQGGFNFDGDLDLDTNMIYGSNSSQNHFEVYDGSTGAMDFYVDNSGSNDHFRWQNPTSTLMFLDSGSGELGIGTTNPASALDVVGGITSSGVLDINGTGTSTFEGGIDIAGSILPRTDAVYDLGSPSLQWRDVYISSGSLYIGGQKVLEENQDGNINITADPDQSISLTATGTGSVNLGANGSGSTNVIGGNFGIGIGTTSPATTLEVGGNALLSGTDRYLNFNSGVGSGGYGIRDDSGTLQFKNSGGSWANLGSGGGTPGGSDGQVQFNNTGSFDGSSNFFWDSANSRLGIGTTSPATALDVSGIITATGGNSTQWNTAYSQRGSQIAGTNLTWNGSQLDATDTDTTYTAGTGLALTGTEFSIASTVLQSGDNISELTNDAGYLSTVDISDDTNLAAGTGATLTGDTLSVDDVETLTTSLTAGSIIFSDGSNLAQDNANFFWDSANARLGIGTNGPSAILEVAANGTTPRFRVESATSGVYALDIDGSDVATLGTGNGHIFLDTSGSTNVGVGTSTPAVDFQVEGIVRQSNALNCDLQANANGDLICAGTSDLNLKTNIFDLNGTSSLAKVNQLQAQTYNYTPEAQLGNRQEIGFIAQDVEKIFPELVGESNGYKYIRYDKLTVVLAEAVQELDDKVAALQSQQASSSQSGNVAGDSDDATTSTTDTSTSSDDEDDESTSDSGNDDDNEDVSSSMLAAVGSWLSDRRVEITDGIARFVRGIFNSVRTNRLVVDNTRDDDQDDEDLDPAAGTGFIATDERKVEIQNNQAATSSQIIVTFTREIDTSYWVEKAEGSFSVHTPDDVTATTTFDYFILGVEMTEDQMASSSAVLQSIEDEDDPVEEDTSGDGAGEEDETGGMTPIDDGENNDSVDESGDSEDEAGDASGDETDSGEEAGTGEGEEGTNASSSDETNEESATSSDETTGTDDATSSEDEETASQGDDGDTTSPDDEADSGQETGDESQDSESVDDSGGEASDEDEGSGDTEGDSGSDTDDADTEVDSGESDTDTGSTEESGEGDDEEAGETESEGDSTNM